MFSINSFYFALIILVIFILIYQYQFFKNTKSVKSILDQENYRVIYSYSDYTSAVDQLAKLNNNILLLLKHIKNKYKINFVGFNDNCSDNRIRTIITRILDRYNPEVIYENKPNNIHIYGTSYTINKGDKLVLCLRNSVNGKIHDLHTLTFVTLHEMAHIGCRVWGHPASFWETFKFILYEAELAGIHKPKNYQLYPINYCGLHIDYNPAFDSTIREIWH